MQSLHSGSIKDRATWAWSSLCGSFYPTLTHLYCGTLWTMHLRLNPLKKTRGESSKYSQRLKFDKLQINNELETFTESGNHTVSGVWTLWYISMTCTPFWLNDDLCKKKKRFLRGISSLIIPFSFFNTVQVTFPSFKSTLKEGLWH